jgi:hypothetical protein
MAIGLLFDFINAKTPNVNQTPNTWVKIAVGLLVKLAVKCEAVVSTMASYGC